MAFRRTFIEELNSLAGETVEIAYDSKLATGVIGFAQGDVLGLVETVPYSQTNQVVYIAVHAIQFVNLLT